MPRAKPVLPWISSWDGMSYARRWMQRQKPRLFRHQVRPICQKPKQPQQPQQENQNFNCDVKPNKNRKKSLSERMQCAEHKK
jgi:hypothetical protein